MFKRSVGVVLVAFLILAGVTFLAPSTRADPEFCTASSSPTNVAAGSDINFQFSFTNTDPSLNIDWITITTPTSSFNIVSVSAAGWNSYIDGAGAQFTNGDLAPGSTLTLNVEVQTGPFVSGEIDWNIFGYDNSTSAGPGGSVCQNSTPANMIDNTPYISGVAPTDLTTSSVDITWITNIPATSQVHYGLDDTYGSSSTLDTNLVINHSVSLTGLIPNTGYHYQAESTTAGGGDNLSGDNTFLTAVNPPIIVSKLPSISIAKNAVNKTPPGISLNTAQIPKVVKSVPTIQGTATDNAGVAKIEYSTDGGKNWLQVNSAPNLGGKSVNFSFTPANLDDGTYQIEARAIDTDGNSATTAEVILVVDRVPPQVGGSIISAGPQVLHPDSNGAVEVLTGTDQKITVHTIGGPTGVNISSQLVGDVTKHGNFLLTQDPTTGLWSGILSFTKSGKYQLIIHSVNGAGESTTQYLQTINAVPQALVISSKTKNIVKVASVVLYYKDIDSGAWDVWDGSAYGEVNPQTSTNGNIHLLVPPGTYYFKVTSIGYQPLISRIFTVNQSLPLSVVLSLNPLTTLNLGFGHLSLPSFSVSSLTINASQSSIKSIINPLVGRAFPNFSLQSTDGSTKTIIDLYGKPTIVAAVSTWAPTTVEQLKVLSNLQKNTNINIVPIFVQDSLANTTIFLQSNGYDLTALADPSGSLVGSLQIGDLPTYYVLNQSGYIKKVMVGVLSENELQSGLVGK